MVGRSSERGALEALLGGAQRGLSGALVLRGEAGVGKTALLDDAAEAAASQGMQVARLTGIESETQLGYAALHRLLLPHAGHLDRLPGPQRHALKGTFGFVAGPPADRFMVALGVLTLLADVAGEDPLLCLVDDVHWLDPESQMVLGFVARRLDAERVAMVLATRESQPSLLSGLPELVIAGLADAAAKDLLSSVAEGTVSPYVAGRLIASTGGNPLALVELARELTADQLSGLSDLPEPLPVGHSLQVIFSRRVHRLSPEARLLLALAATEPSASQTTLWRAAAQLGIDPDLATSELGDLVGFTPQVTFRHPLVCSVAYHLTPIPQRRRIHQALADRGEGPDRVAWHLGLAASGPDEAVAARLEHTAERARQRGGYAATVTFLARAAELSVREDLRTRRLLAAAEAALAAGQPVRARILLDQAHSGSRSDPQAGSVLRLAGQVAFAIGQPGDAARQLLAAAKRLMPVDARLGRRSLLDALTAAAYTREDVMDQVRAFAAIDVAKTAVDLQDPSATADCLLLGFLHRLSGAPRQTAPLLRAAVSHISDPATPDPIRISLPLVVSVLACNELMDERGSHEVVNIYANLARQAGALRLLPTALAMLAAEFLFQGRFDDAEEICAEGRALGEATGVPGNPDVVLFTELGLLCWRGRENEARDLAARIVAQEEHRGGASSPSFYLVPLELSRGQYRQAYDQALPGFRDDRIAAGTLALPDFIESAVRCQELEVARAALNRLEERAEASGAHWGLGRLARCQALMAGDEAAARYCEAIDLLEPTGYLTDLARTHLLYGEWLRRQRRRREARLQLGVAHEIFSGMGAEAFAERSRAELAATGETARKRKPETKQTLTAQEAQVARFVAEGGTNRDVAAQLFISPATVDYHLRKVYQKLGVTSRTQLVRRILTT